MLHFYNHISTQKQTLTLQQGLHQKALSEVELLGEHGHHAGDLLLLAEARIVRLRLEIRGHHVVDPSEDLHDLQLLAMLIQHRAQGLHKPGAPSRISPGVIT